MELALSILDTHPKLGAPADLPPWVQPPSGPLALPGTYRVTLAKLVDGVTTPLTDPVDFQVASLDLATFAAEDRKAVTAFQAKVARLQRAVLGTRGLRASWRRVCRTSARQLSIRRKPIRRC